MEISDQQYEVTEKSFNNVTTIPPPPPLPNFMYPDNEDDSLGSNDGSLGSCSSLEFMEDDTSQSQIATFKSDTESLLSNENNRPSISVNNFYQDLLINLNEAYTSMKELCFDDLSPNLRPNVKKCWMMYLKEFTEITEGMVCTWKKTDSKKDCESTIVSEDFQKLKIIGLNTESLMVTIEKMEPESEETIPTVVPIWQLRPDVNSNAPMQFTLECLRLCRFFFEKLWFSWDTEDIEQFFEENLERRIQFLYDVENGLLSTKEEKAIIEMIRRSRALEQKIIEIESADVEDCEDGNDDELLKLLELQLEQEEIGNKIKRLENPVWRVLMKKLELTKIAKQKEQRCGVGDAVFLVCANSSPKALKKVSQIIESKFRCDYINIQVVNSLELALSTCSPEGTIFITPGTYQISGLNNFEYGGSIVGISMDDMPIVLEQSEMSSIWLMMDFNVQNLLYFENIVFMTEFYDDIKYDHEDYENGCKTQVGIMIKGGHLHMKNCVVEGRHEQMDQECHEITHSAMVKVADEGDGIFTCQNTKFKNVKCLYWKDGKSQQVVEKPISRDWEIK